MLCLLCIMILVFFYSMQQNWNWTWFCGHKDNLVVWDPSVNDFGQCFEVVCLQIPLLTFLAVVAAYYCGKHSGWIVRGSFELKVLRLRYLSTLLLLTVMKLALCTIFVPYIFHGVANRMSV